MNKHETIPVGRRLDVQGLRALAVGLVLGYHLWPTKIPEGFVGVDVFFVISGFVITGPLAASMIDGRGRPDLVTFYARRIRRLLPAALTVLFTVVVVTFVAVPPTRWAGISRQVVSATLYVHNWALYRHAVDYLSRPQDDPVQHFWSLGVEEQFYALWPLLLILAWALGRGRARLSLALAVGVISLASFGLSLWWTASSPAQAYFSSPVRIWEFGAGALLALVPVRLDPGRWAGPAAWTGLAVIVGSAQLLPRTTAFPGWIAVLPVAGAALVLVSGDVTGRTSPAWLLRRREVQWVGDHAYSLYLWHWPLIVLIPAATGTALDSGWRFGVLVASVGLAVVTRRWVELPFQRAPTRAKEGFRVPSTLVGTGLVLTAAGALWMRVDARTFEADQLLGASLNTSSACFGAGSAPVLGACSGSLPAAPVPDPLTAGGNVLMPQCLQRPTRPEVVACEVGSTAPAAPRVALVGDSQAHQWLPAVRSLAERHGWHVTTFTKAACTYFDATVDYNVDPSCRSWNRQVQHRLLNGDFSLVLLSTSAERPAGLPPGPDPDRAARLARTWTALTRNGSEVVALRSTPIPATSGLENPPECLSRHPGDPQACTLQRRLSLGEDAQVEAVPLTPGAALVDLSPWFCDRASCPTVIGGVVVYRDAVHISATYSLTLAPYLDRELREKGLLPRTETSDRSTASPSGGADGRER